MKTRNALFIATGVLLSAFAAYKRFTGIPYQIDMIGAATQLAGALFVVTLFVERSTAVLNSIWFSESIRQAKAIKSVEMTQWISAESRHETLPTPLLKSIEALTRIEAQQEKVRSGAGFIIATFVSAAGVRTLQFLQILPAANSSEVQSFQYAVYHAADILITAGLISGGSNGLHNIIDLLSNYVATTKEKLNMDRYLSRSHTPDK
ncbi:hypothetical protein [Burkholderia pseudomallei]|uniref:hypothetical protein n=2 Tax=Burkholderia pseudomallei TaxID=28450 RepID=UPI001177B323|nr:hypothetical protein [Burkholderia pseudomallei]